MSQNSYVVIRAYIAILPNPVLSCEAFLRVSIKITVHVLAAGCQLTYRKVYGFLQCSVQRPIKMTKQTSDAADLIRV